VGLPTGPAALPSRDDLERRLNAFLTWWLGTWPPSGRLVVSGSPVRTRPGWDGQVRPVLGVATPIGTVVSVPIAIEKSATELARPGFEPLSDAIGALVGRPRAKLVRGIFRWSERVVDLPEAGEWVPRTDPRIPPWLRPFNGDVLVAFDDDKYAAGVGLKRHSPLGIEIAVGTEQHHRGKGLASRLVAQASRRILAEGAIALYLHARDNVASAHVAERAGFPDDGWEIIELWQGSSRP